MDNDARDNTKFNWSNHRNTDQTSKPQSEFQIGIQFKHQFDIMMVKFGNFVD